MAHIVNGSDLMLFIGNKSIACATSCSISINANLIETSSKDSGDWATSAVRKFSWSCSSDNLFSTTEFGKLFNAFIAKDELTIIFSLANAGKDAQGYFEPDTDLSGYPLTGKVIIESIEANAADGDNATFTINFTGTGKLSIVA